MNIYNYLRFIKRHCQRVSLEKRKYFLLIQTSKHHLRNKIIVISFIWNIRKCIGNLVYPISKHICMGWRTVVLIKNILQEHGTVELFTLFQNKDNCVRNMKNKQTWKQFSLVNEGRTIFNWSICCLSKNGRYPNAVFFFLDKKNMNWTGIVKHKVVYNSCAYALVLRTWLRSKQK